MSPQVTSTEYASAREPLVSKILVGPRSASAEIEHDPTLRREVLPLRNGVVGVLADAWKCLQQIKQNESGQDTLVLRGIVVESAGEFTVILGPPDSRLTCEGDEIQFIILHSKNKLEEVATTVREKLEYHRAQNSFVVIRAIIFK